MDINTMITTYSTDAGSEILGKERRRKKARDVLNLFDERRFEEEVVSSRWNKRIQGSKRDDSESSEESKGGLDRYCERLETCLNRNK